MTDSHRDLHENRLGLPDAHDQIGATPLEVLTQVGGGWRRGVNLSGGAVERERWTN
ncbi:hypothetical protein GYH30_018589 [Glycine max]|nr:hypothetical protein GYH30_018589 [Glycine max]